MQPDLKEAFGIPVLIWFFSFSKRFGKLICWFVDTFKWNMFLTATNAPQTTYFVQVY
jgi:hypothetical protein